MGSWISCVGSYSGQLTRWGYPNGSGHTSAHPSVPNDSLEHLIQEQRVEIEKLKQRIRFLERSTPEDIREEKTICSMVGGDGSHGTIPLPRRQTSLLSSNRLSNDPATTETPRADPQAMANCIRLKSIVSTEELDKIVNDILDCKDTNNPYVPDFVERKIYSNVFFVVATSVKKAIEQTKIELLGHEIEMRMLPKQDPTPTST